MEFLTNLLENSTMPWLSALVLGLMTAISPCPLATNITAVGFVSKDIENRNRVFLNGLLYTLGRAISYTAIALIIYFGADQFKFSGFFQLYGEKIVGPLLIIIGLFMLDVIKINFLPLQRRTLFWYACANDCCKRNWIISSHRFCTGNRYSGDHFCMDTCLFGWFNRWSL